MNITKFICNQEFEEAWVNRLSTIDNYCDDKSFTIARIIDDNLKFVIKPKPWWCPNWLYKKIIRESVLLVSKPK